MRRNINAPSYKLGKIERTTEKEGKIYGCIDLEQAAVCGDQRVSLHLRAAHLGALHTDSLYGNPLRQDGGRDLSEDDEVLGEAVPHQLRTRSGYRNYHGVPVRHELGRVLQVCGGHLWGAAGH